MIAMLKKSSFLFLVLLLISSCSVVTKPYEGYTKPQSGQVLTQDFLYEASTGIFHFYTNDTAKLSGSGSTFWKLSDVVAGWTGAANYEVSVQAAKISGVASAGYGLVFSALDVQNFLCVLITKDGNMQVGQVINRVYSTIPDWTSGWTTINALNVGYGQYNTLKVTYQAGLPKPFKVFVNAEVSPVIDFAAPAFNSGNKAGFITVLSSGQSFPNIPVETAFKIITPQTLVISGN